MHSVLRIFLHIFQRESVVQEQAGAAVPKLMKADMRQMVVLQEKREMGRYIVRGKGSTIRPLEDKVVFLIVRAAELSVDLFLGLGLDKDFFCLG